MDEVARISEMLDSWWNEGVRVVSITTWDEELVAGVARRLAEMREVPFWQWSRVKGLVRLGESLSGQLTREPETLVDKLFTMPSGVVVAYDLLTEDLSARVQRAVRELAARTVPHMLIIVTPPGIPIPELLSRDVISFVAGDLMGPRLKGWVRGRVASLAEAVERQQIETPGLEIHHPQISWDQVGGLIHLKAWAEQRALALDGANGLPFPRGVLLYGVPGTGKSLSVTAWANSWGLPLLRLNWAGLMGRYVGQSEAQLMAALRVAERLSPVMLWVDELDKAIGRTHAEEDSGVSQRLLGILLTWLQEHQAPVLLLATANEVEGLPAELLRPGRFDALFFVDLPDAEVRQEILQIHLRQAGVENPEKYSTVGATWIDFSGADIREAVIDARFLAAQSHEQMSVEILARAGHRVIPWARTLGEELERRREWAHGRMRFA